jgi:hypothetical protein
MKSGTKKIGITGFLLPSIRNMSRHVAQSGKEASVRLGSPEHMATEGVDLE